MTTLVYHNKFLFWRIKRKLSVAGSFDELTSKQFIQAASLLYTGGEELLLHVKALKALSGISVFRLRTMRSEIVDRAIQHATWLFAKDVKVAKQLLPKYKGLYGPASDFENLRMREFHATERLYVDLVKTKDPVQEIELLNNLAAVLYRPGKKGYDTERDPDGDIRTSFNHNESAYYVKKISKWPLQVKQAIFVWYDSCRNELMKNNLKLPSTSEFESQYDVGVYSLIRSLAGEKLGTKEVIENMYVHEAMLELNLIKEEEYYYEQKLKTNSA